MGCVAYLYRHNAHPVVLTTRNRLSALLACRKELKHNPTVRGYVIYRDDTSTVLHQKGDISSKEVTT